MAQLERERLLSREVERTLVSCLEAHSSPTQARWVVQLSQMLWPFGLIPADEDLESFLDGPFQEAATAVLGEWTACQAIQDVQTLFHLVDDPVPPRHSTFRPRGTRTRKTTWAAGGAWQRAGGSAATRATTAPTTILKGRPRTLPYVELQPILDALEAKKASNG